MFGLPRTPIHGHSAFHICGCYFLVPSQPNPEYLPLVESEAHTTIFSTSSKTILKQTFSNNSSKNIEECIYTFPLYDGIGVVGFTCKIGSKTLVGLVREKLEAKKIFDEAVAKGETAGLLQQAPQASDVWSTKIGNIPAGQSVIVEITYVGELKHTESDGIRFTIPTRIAPRYGSGPAATYTAKAREEGGIKITVDVNMPDGSKIRSIDSPSHQIKVSMGTVSTATQADPVLSKASATLSLGSAALEKDFVLIVQSKDVGIPKAILETHPDFPNHRALMATLVPKFSIPPIRPEIVFVADRSGSMRNNIPMLVSAMKVFLKSMPSGVKFNICSFGSSHTFLWPKSETYTSESLAFAMNHLNSFDANMGGTETHNAIKATIDRRYTDIPLEVIVLTDGDIWNQESLFAYINEQVALSKGNIRVFTLGIGSGVSSALIEGLARAGNGFAQSVQDGERLDSSVVRMLRGSLSPHVSNYTLEVTYEPDDNGFVIIEKVTDGMKVLLNKEEQPAKPASISLFDSNVDEKQLETEMKASSITLPVIPYPKLLQAPQNIPSLFAFSRTTVYLLMSAEASQKTPKSVVLKGTTTDGADLSIEIPVETLSTPAKTIHQLAAKKAVQDLEEGRGWLSDCKNEVTGTLVKDQFPSAFTDLVKKEAVRLGEKFQVAGKWCSFVAVTANASALDAKSRTVQANEDEDMEDEDMEIIETPTVETSSVDEFSTSAFCRSPLMAPRRAMPKKSAIGFGSPAPAAPAARGALTGGGRGGVMMRMANVAPLMQLSAGTSLHAQSTGVAPPQVSSYGASPANSLFSPPPPPPLVNPAIPLQHPTGGTFAALSEAKSGPGTSSSATAQPSPGGGGLFGNSAGVKSFDKSAQSSSLFGGAREGTIGSISPPASAPSQPFASRSRSAVSSNIGSGSVPFGLNSNSSATNWAAKSIAERVLAVIELQQFDGSWKSSPQLSAILALEKSPSSTTEWITMFVVRWLEIKCASEEATFEMVVEKARDWLAANASGLQNLEQEVSLIVNSS